MARTLILITAACVALVLPAARGTSHLSFSNDTQVNVTRNGCGQTSLCLEEPTGCDPAGNGTCLFASLNAATSAQPNSFNLNVSLSGNSTGYIALGLTQNPNEGITMLFVCGINGTNNSSFFFATRNRTNSNNALTANERNTTEIRGTVIGSRIQCNFIIPNINTTRDGETLDGTTGVVLLGNGSVTGTTPLSFNVLRTSGLVNLTNANGNITIRVISRNGCGNTKLCVQSPVNCNPQDLSCLFTSLNATTGIGSGFNLSVELSGNSSGFIGMGLTRNANQGITTLYVCGRNNSNNNTFFFLTLDRNNSNGNLTQSDQKVRDLSFVTVGTSIQCIFTIPNANSVTTRETSSGSVGQVLLGSGTLTNGGVTTFNPSLTTVALNFTNPTGTITPTTILNINRDGCGQTVLCLETPKDCNPQTNRSCLFTSIDDTGTNPLRATIRLSGNSSGYVGFGLTQSRNPDSEGTTLLFACARNLTGNGMFFFRVVLRNNTDGTFLAVNRVVTNVGVVNGTSIECEFNFVNETTGQIGNQTVANVLLGTGIVTGDVLGPFNIQRQGFVNLTDVNGKINAGTMKRSDAMVVLLSFLSVWALL